ncbi:hypothetical protein SAMD00019534_005720 [Acytostelium subglobosum LB1]|uniref:hypothetical protein n=1 Tax=Acytostelium subglobosum LB1 TaxID=1410327 RepID=UPI00064508AB|nr:hypothetical protein SAMD00019534_005720 [Acytostelium subglobosum LB1]GAM17397.1 hypothetical protein SAMD00019534_005720 [Acytostelium subglobosum LB1]|eukprot:XP_012759459.1 hypothetical protein SAMD00019534_005720 [Acytostelium subglobosum LB1]
MELISCDRLGTVVLLLNADRVVVIKIRQFDSRFVMYVERHFSLAPQVDDEDDDEDDDDEENGNKNKVEEEEEDKKHKIPDELVIKSIDKWIFIMRRNVTTGVVHVDVWSINGRQRGSINIWDYLQKHNAATNEAIMRDFSVSSDKETMTLRDDKQRIYVIALDTYFQRTPQTHFDTDVVLFNKESWLEQEDRAHKGDDNDEDNDEENEDDEEEDDEESIDK